MEEERKESTNNAGGRKIASSTGCDVEALKKCLEETKGDYLKCQSHIDAFRSSCSRPPASKPTPPPKLNH